MRAVIFDWGGVLVRTVDQEPRHTWEQRLGLEPGELEHIIHGSESWQDAQLGRISSEVHWRNVIRRLNLEPEQIHDLRYDFYRCDQLDRDLIELIRGLRQQGLLVGLLSNNTMDLAVEIDALRIRHFFNAVLISAQFGVLKPDPRAYQAVLKTLHISAHDAVFVDDFAENVRGARAAGMGAIHFTPELDLRTELRRWLSL